MELQYLHRRKPQHIIFYSLYNIVACDVSVDISKDQNRHIPRCVYAELQSWNNKYIKIVSPTVFSYSFNCSSLCSATDASISLFYL